MREKTSSTDDLTDTGCFLLLLCFLHSVNSSNTEFRTQSYEGTPNGQGTCHNGTGGKNERPARLGAQASDFRCHGHTRGAAMAE